MAEVAELSDQPPLPSISSVLSLPVDIVVRRVRNVREAELLLQVSSTATNLETAVSAYEVLALKLEDLKTGWDALWLSNEAFLNPAIPLIGQAMSQQNAARGHVIQQIEDLVATLQQQASALTQFADMHRSYARELSAEGLGKLAAEKLLLCDIEQELSARITRVCSGGGLAGLRPLSEVVQEMEASLLTPPRPTAPPADRTDAEGHQDAVEHGGHAVKLMAVGMERDGLKGGGAGTEPEPETDMEPGTRTGKGPGPEPERGEARGRDELLDNGVEGESLGKNAGVADRDGFQEDGVMEVAQSGLNRVEMAEDLVRTTGLLRTEKPCVGSRIGVVEKGRDERDNMDLGRGSNKRSREDYLEGEREPDTEKSGLGKRLRGADFSGSRDNAPRIAAEAEQPSPGRRADPPIGDERFARIAGQRLVRPGPFSPNLAASFQLEERLEGIAPEEGRAEGKRPEGERPEEEVAEEEKPGATRLEGRRPEEEGPEAEWSEERPEEGGTKAKSPKEGRPEGRRPEEDRQERKRPEEDGPKGRRPETERPEGKRPEEEWPEGQRPEEEWPDESGSKEAPGSDEIDWGKVGDRKGGRQGDASAPAFGCAEEGFRGGKRRELDGSETERGRELDPSISSLERQLLTDEKLTPGSSSVSRGNFHSTRSPPSSGRKAGDSSQGRNGDLLALEQRPSTDRSSPPGGLALPRMSNGGLQRRPLSTNDESKAMPPPTSSPIQHHASAAGLVGEASEPKSRSRGNERTRESSGLPDPVQSGQEPSQDATPPEHSPGSQTQSLFQSQAEQAVSQRTPGTDLPPEKSGRNDGLYGSPSPNVAFQLRLSGSSSSPSKSPGSEKLSQTGGGLLESVTLRGQSRVLAYGESGRATPDGGTAELGNGTEALKQGGGLFENESRRLSEGARRVAESSGGGMEGGMTEMEGGTERLEGKLARDAGGMANMAGGLAGSEHGKGELKDGTEQMEGGTAGLESRRLEAEGGTADFEHGRAKGERGTAEVLLTAANGAEGAAFTGKKLLSESREAHVTRRVELTEGLLLQVRRIVDKSAVEKAGAPGTLSTGQRISGALSRGRNDPADPGTQNNNEKAADMEEGQGALSLPEAAAERSLSHAEVRGYELELQNPVFPVRELPANHQSEPFSGGGKRSDVVPPGAALDSEEGGTHSSGRGVNPGATPPPSSKSCSRDDLPERARGVVPDERKPDKADRLLNNRASAANSEDGSETASESGETELVPETEETEEETEEQGCGQEKASLGREPTLAASPCRASESPGMSGSQPLSQSQVF